MERYLKRKLESPFHDQEKANKSTKLTSVEFNSGVLLIDPGLKIPIMEYDPNIWDEVRWAYMLKGPCQTKDNFFPYKYFGVIQDNLI